jgi:hypothetical protein
MEYDMLITGPFPKPTTPSDASTETSAKNLPQEPDHAPMPEPRTEKPRKSSSWQATDATDADHQGRLVVADMAHSLEKGKRPER